uniref:Uncharacterized protein n=1 Tax=Oryza punctata TaxID=4537 RepID=A0A0E0MIU2_ORYPU
MIFIVSLLTASEEPRVKKLLVQHIETVHHSEAVQDVLHSLLHSDLDAKEIKSKTKEWNNRTKQDKDLGRNARFAQIWRSRKGDRNEVDESLREICHLYDAVQVDSGEEKHPAEPRQRLQFYAIFFHLYGNTCHQLLKKLNQILFRWHHQKIQMFMTYILSRRWIMIQKMEGTSSASYPLLQVDDDDDPYDTDDSNAEDNPLYDYPEELSEDGDDGSDSKNPFSDPYGSDPEYEKEEVEEDNDEDGSREIDGLGANMG